MRKFKLFTFAVILNFLYTGSLFAQISYGGKPISFNTQNQAFLQKSLPTVTMQPVNVTLLQAEDIANENNKSIPWRFGQNIDVNISMSTSGQIDYLPNGDKIWRLRIYSQGALTLNFGFSKYNLPDGATLFLYNEVHTEVLGSFTSANNTPEQKFATTLIPGEAITLEYYEPANALFSGELTIDRVTHGYRNVFDFAAKALGESGACQRNTICPESAGWEQQIRSACMLVVGGSGFCSGALINNTLNNATPYVLTANHCSTSNDFSSWIFWFNWQSAVCTPNPTTSPAHDQVSTAGCVLKSRNAGSDFCLVQMNATPPCTFNPYYSGWSRSSTPATSTTCIHHPSGDIKKISFSTQAAVASTMSGATTWFIQWTTGSTCTEPGSSGSPLYDQNKRIIGQLYGGASYCGAASGSMNDEYGQLAVSWAGGGTSATRLSDWLDPSGTAPMTLDGYDPCQTTAPVADFTATPTTANCTGLIQFTDASTGSPASWLWDFGDGQTATSQSPSHTYTTSGTYTITLTVTNINGTDQMVKPDYITVNIPATPVATGGSRCGAGIVNLSATGSGILHWFDAASGGTELTTGLTYSPNITTTTTYYVENHIQQASQYVGPLAAGNNNTTSYYISFNCLTPVILVSVSVTASTAGNRTIELRNSSNAVLLTTTVNIPTGSSRVTLNFNIPTGTGLRLYIGANANLSRLTSGISYPYTLTGLISITGSNAGTTRFPYFFDWEIKTPDCVSPRTPVVATINAPVAPTVSITATETSICPGTSVTFNATPTNGGTPTYQWLVNGSNAATGASFTSTALINGDIVTCVMTSTATCITTPTVTSNSIVMNVSNSLIPAVSIAASTTTICSGTSVTFTPTPTNGGTPTYQWQINGNNEATGATFTSTLLNNNDQVTCIMTSSLSCASTPTANSNIITMTVSEAVTPTILISADATTICPNDYITFTAFTSHEGNTPFYQWQLNGVNVGPNSAIATTNLLSNNDVVTCILTSSETCTSVNNITSNPITITISGSAPTSSYTYTQNNLDFTFTNTSIGAVSYLWDFGDGTTSTLQNPTHTYSNPGMYDVILTSYNSCDSNQVAHTVNAIESGISNTVTPLSVSIYPNPSIGITTIDIKGNESNNAEITIHDAIGKIMYNNKLTNMLENAVVNVDLSSYEKGIYYFTVRLEKETKHFKVIRK